MLGHPVKNTHILRSVVEKATSQDPVNRYQDAGEMLDAFERRIENAADEELLEEIREKD